MAITQNTEERTLNSGFLSRLRSYCVFLPLIYLYTAIMGSLSLLSSFFDRDGRIQHWFAVHWARMILATARVCVHVEGAEHIDPAHAAVTRRTISPRSTFRYCIRAFRGSSVSWPSANSSAIPSWDGTSRAPAKFPLTRATHGLRCVASIARVNRCGKACR